jgi:WD40 repeat protein
MTLRVMTCATLVALMLLTSSGCGLAEAEKARQESLAAEMEARRAAEEARRAEENARVQVEQAVQQARQERNNLLAQRPLRADEKPKDPKEKPEVSPELLHTFEGHEDTVICLAFSQDNRKFVAGVADGTVHVWDIKSKKETVHKGHKGSVLAVTFADDGGVWSVGEDGTLRYFGDKKIEPLKLEAHEDKITCAAFSPTAQQLVTGSLDKKAILWEVAGAKKLSVYTGHTKGVTCVAFDSRGESILSGGQDGKVARWSPNGPAATFEYKTRQHGNWVSASYCFVDDATMWWVTTGTNGLISHDTDSDKPPMKTDPRCGALHCLAITREGKRLVVGAEDRVLRLYTLVRNGSNPAVDLGKYLGHTDAVKCVATSPDGKLILSGSEDKTVRLWKLP